MGCCQAKPDESKELNKIVSGLEAKLKIRSIELKKIVKECYRCSTDLVVNDKQLSILCESLKIEKETSDYNLIKACFDNEIMGISVLKIITLCILVSGATRNEKVRVLFDIFHDKNQRLMLEMNIKSMIINIFDISVQNLVDEAISMSDINTAEMLKQYKEKLLYSKNLIVFYYFHYIIDTKQSLTTFEFDEYFTKPQLTVLLNPELMRKFSFKTYKSTDLNHDIKTESFTKQDIDLIQMRGFPRRLSRKVR